MHIVIFSEPGCYKVFMCNRPMHMEPLAPQLCRGGEVLRPGAVRPRMPGQGAGGNVHRGPGEGWRTAGVVAWMCVGGGQFPVSESTCFAQSCTPRQARSLPSGNVKVRLRRTVELGAPGLQIRNRAWGPLHHPQSTADLWRINHTRSASPYPSLGSPSALSRVAGGTPLTGTRPGCLSCCTSGRRWIRKTYASVRRS